MSTRSLTRWNGSFGDFDTLVRSAFGPSAFGPSAFGPSASGFQPAAEIVRDGTDAVVRLELPGVDVTKDVTVEVENGRLVVRGERRDEHSSDEHGRTLREVRYGAFRRSFALPAGVTADAISASYDAGVLSVRVTGAHADTDPKQIAITQG